jgi:NAD(P)-dependent dehydrogenase (short-subunit alcohol dehydrogenase family)
MTMSQGNGTPRLSLVDPDTSTDEVAEAFKRLPVINVFRAMANAETLYPTYIAYVALLFKPLALDAALAKEMRGRDITVNAVAPGPTATPLFLDGKPQEVLDAMKNMSPLERLGEPADIAEAVAFLAGPARWVNGQVIYANGGVI